MGENKFIQYYSRKAVQKAIVEVSADREVSSMHGEAFGRRPDTVQFPGDVLDMAKKGATSFHVSEERWKDPMDLKPGMLKKDLDENRKGWDLILDIDTPYWDYARWCSYLLVEAIKSYNIENISVKFSGSKGFHIGLPFEAFPDKVGGVKTKDLFPALPKILTLFLEDRISERLAQKMLEKDNISNILAMTGKKRKEIMKKEKFNPFSLVDIDTILISSRHMFRSPYSMHEKTKLVSLPIDCDRVLMFKKKEAKPDNVKVNLKYLDRAAVKKNEAKQLIIQAYDWHSKKFKKNEKDDEAEKFYELPKKAIGEEHFPACIANILKGGMEDGKKRALFILINFLRSVGWDIKTTKARVKEWNKKNKEQLREVYINAQMSWHSKQRGTVLPPNCANDGYYKDLRICCDEPVCKKFKNPVNFAKKQSRMKKKRVVKKKVVKKVKPK